MTRSYAQYVIDNLEDGDVFRIDFDFRGCDYLYIRDGDVYAYRVSNSMVRGDERRVSRGYVYRVVIHHRVDRVGDQLGWIDGHLLDIISQFGFDAHLLAANMAMLADSMQDRDVTKEEKKSYVAYASQLIDDLDDEEVEQKLEEKVIRVAS